DGRPTSEPAQRAANWCTACWWHGESDWRAWGGQPGFGAVRPFGTSHLASECFQCRRAQVGAAHSRPPQVDPARPSVGEKYADLAVGLLGQKQGRRPIGPLPDVLLEDLGGRLTKVFCDPLDVVQIQRNVEMAAAPAHQAAGGFAFLGLTWDGSGHRQAMLAQFGFLRRAPPGCRVCLYKCERLGVRCDYFSRS
ncbi:MAG: hypothetical protein ACI9WU_004674, partial [Myxococcota bacterium]